MDQAQRLRELVRATPPEPVGPAAVPRPRARNAPGAAAPRLLAITSGKGGVGKSNLSVNLALCFARWGYRTWLWDVDVALGNADILLGLFPQYHLGHVVFGDRTLQEIVLEGPAGLRVIPAGSGWQQLAELGPWRLNRLIEDLAFVESDADFVLLDTGAGIGHGVVQFALAGQEVILVTTPEPTALADAYSLLKVIDGINPGARIQLVVNQVESEQEARLVHARLQQVADRFLQRGVTLLGGVPRDDAVRVAVQRQEPFLLAFPRAPASRAVEAIARRLLGYEDAAHPEPLGVRGVIRRMVGLLRREAAVSRR